MRERWGVLCTAGSWKTSYCKHGPCRMSQAEHLAGRYAPVGPLLRAELEKLRIPESHWRLTRRLWEMDHIVPVVEGGGSCGLDNLRTLCVACHRKETAKLAKRRAKRGRYA